MAVQGKKINELTAIGTVSNETVLPAVYVSGTTVNSTANKISIEQISTKVQDDMSTTLAGKQDTLVSGTNIKTINNESLLGSGNLDVDGLPSQSGQSGKYLTTDGTNASWANVNSLPSQTGQNGKFLKTDGTNASWDEVNVPSNVWTQDNLVAGKNITITKKIDPTIITEDTVAVWHFDGTGTDSVNGLYLYNYPANGAGFYFDANNKKFDSTSSMWKQLSADTYYSGTYFSNWFGADLRTYSLSSNKDMTIDFWYKPPVSTSATVARRGTIFALMYKSAPDYFSHGIYIVPNSDNTAISFGLANNYSGGTLGTAFIEDVPVTATFHHIAFELRGSTGSTVVTVYVDGIAKGSTTISNSSDFAYQQFNVFTTNVNNDAPSWVDELRLSKGLVYNGNFDNNLPTKPYSNDVGEDVYQINATGSGDGADTDLSNLTNTGKIKVAHLAMPSDVVETLSIPAANSYLTAPADGYYYAMTSNIIDMTLFQRGTTSWDDDKIIFRAIQNTGFEYGYAIIPVSAGQVLNVGPTTILSFKFIYLNGNSN